MPMGSNDLILNDDEDKSTWIYSSLLQMPNSLSMKVIIKCYRRRRRRRKEEEEEEEEEEEGSKR